MLDGRSLDENQLVGPIPETIGQLTRLEYLYDIDLVSLALLTAVLLKGVSTAID